MIGVHPTLGVLNPSLEHNTIYHPPCRITCKPVMNWPRGQPFATDNSPFLSSGLEGADCQREEAGGYTHAGSKAV